MNAVGTVIEVVLWVFIGCLWVRFITGWVMLFARSWSPRGVLLVGLEVVFSTTDPPIKAIDRAIPPLRLGSFVLPLGFLLVFVLAHALYKLNGNLLL